MMAQFIVPIGPQHPALKEPGHFEFVVEGETVTSASVRLGYAHRGIEKATESRNWTQDLYLLERICGICSHIHALAFALGVEQLAGVEVPPRAQAIRVIVAELERLQSHLLWLGVAAHEAGFDTLFMACWQDRESLMALFEQISGNRVHYAVNVLGGVRVDFSPPQIASIQRVLDMLDARVRHYGDVVTSDRVLLRRIRGVGVLPTDQALDLGVTGPVARASDVRRDLRVDAPYAAYADFPIDPITESAGDLLARFSVRLREMLGSSTLIRRVLAALPDGELTTRIPRKIRPGEAVVRVEAPRGELFYFIQSAGGEMPSRVKVRTPTLRNIGAVLSLVIGQRLADVPMILAGVDPCFSCNDRLVSINAAGMTWEQLRQYGVDYYTHDAGQNFS